jgi:hypothetical protein
MHAAVAAPIDAKVCKLMRIPLLPAYPSYNKLLIQVLLMEV